MDTTQEKLEIIKEKIVFLTEQLNDSVSIISDLRTENDHLRKNLEIQNEEIKSFKNRDKITKIVEGVTGGDEKSAALKHKINEYIKEIDKCIAYLSD